MTPRRAEAERLLSLAQADEQAFLWLLQGQGLRPAAAFFFAQQAIEKALKAVMIARALMPSRSHDLLALAKTLETHGFSTPIAADDLASLTPYAVTYRYDDETLSLVSPEEARRMVAEILAWAREMLD